MKTNLWSLTLRNMRDLVLAWRLIPVFFTENGLWSSMRRLLNELADVFIGFLAVCIVLLTPLFFWLAPVMAYRQLQALKKLEHTELPSVWGDVCQPPADVNGASNEGL